MTTIKINESHLGTDATPNQARRLIAYLAAEGYDVEYGDPGPVAQLGDIDDDDWTPALAAAAGTLSIVKISGPHGRGMDAWDVTWVYRDERGNNVGDGRDRVIADSRDEAIRQIADREHYDIDDVTED